MTDLLLQRDLQIAALQLQGGRLDAAEKLCGDLAARAPQDAQPLYLLGVIAQQRGDMATARSHYLSAAQLPNCPEDSFLRLAEVAKHAGGGSEVTAALRRAASVAPKSADVWFELGLAEFAEGGPRTAVAIEALRRAISLGRSTADAWLALALAQEKKKDYAGAAETVTRAIGLFPEEIRFKVRQADALYKNDDWEAAAAAWDALVEAHPGEQFGWIRKAGFHVNVARYYQWAYRYGDADGELALAEAALATAQELPGDAPEVMVIDGLIGNLKAQWTRAEMALRQAVQRNPTALNERSLGYCLTYQGKLVEAEHHLSASLTRDPDDGDAQRHFAHVRRWQGKLDDLVEYADFEPRHDVGFAGRPTDALMHGCRLPMVVMADHDFELHAELSWPESGPAGAALLRPLKDFCFEIGIDGNGLPILSIGDGGGWRRVDRFPLAGRPVSGRMRLVLVRTGNRISARVDDQSPCGFNVGPDLLIPGDNLVPGNPESDIPVRLERFLLRVRNYDVSAVPPIRRVDISTIFFGDMFTRLMAHTMLPSLLLPDNLPSLAGEYEIVQHIYCTSRELPLLHQVKRILDRAGIEWRVNTEILGQGGPGAARAYLYQAVWDQTEISLDRNALVLMAPPDHVFGRGLARTLRAMKPYDYLVVGHPRVMMETAYADLRRDLARPDVAEFFTNSYLVDFAMHRHPHTVIKTGLENPDEFWWNSRREGDSYYTRFKEPPPVAWYPARDLLCVMTGNPYVLPFETIDHDMVDLMQRTGRLRWIDDSDDFFWVEYCKKTRNVPTIYNRYWSPAARMFTETDLRWRLP